MERKLVLDLWEARFWKLFFIETGAEREYRKFLKTYAHLLDGSRIKTLVRKIARDEKRHIAITDRLIQIVKEERNHKRGRKPLTPS